jgi:putative acetyltransferase
VGVFFYFKTPFTMDIVYRPILKDDNFALAKMIRDAFHEFDAPQKGTVYSDPTTDDLYTLFQQENAVCWVALSQNIPVGCCGVFPTPGLAPNVVELVKFYLSHTVRGKGIGNKLFQLSLQSAMEIGYDQVYIESLPHFKKAIQLYEQNGFVFLNKPLLHSQHPGCDIWMLKKL